MGNFTDKKAKALPAGTHGDGGGLYLQVTDTGARSWLFRYKRGTKTSWVGLGGFPTVSLAEARVAAVEAKRHVRSGLDPIEAKKEAKAAREEAAGRTFEAVADLYIKAKSPGWKNAKHAAQWKATLKAYAYPVIGGKNVGSITAEHVKAILEPIWTEKPETASRVRGRIENVLDYAATFGWRSGDNPARWKGHLEHSLADRAKVARVEHHPAVPWAELPAVMAKLAASSGTAAACLRFATLTAARSGEARGALWEEIDMSAGVWNVPAERMKANRPHRVPLSPAALAILRAAYPPGVTEKPAAGLVFPGARALRPLSDVAVAKALRVAGGRDATPHGMRSAFRDWAAEVTAFPREICEAALAHTNRDRVEAAYLRGDHFEKRRALMAAWADHCVPPAGGAVNQQNAELTLEPAGSVER